MLKSASAKSVTLEKGDFFGDEAIFNGKPRSYSVEAISAASVLTLSRSHLLSIIAECPAVAVAFLQVYTQRFSLIREVHA